MHSLCVCRCGCACVCVRNCVCHGLQNAQWQVCISPSISSRRQTDLVKAEVGDSQGSPPHPGLGSGPSWGSSWSELSLGAPGYLCISSRGCSPDTARGRACTPPLQPRASQGRSSGTLLGPARSLLHTSDSWWHSLHMFCREGCSAHRCHLLHKSPCVRSRERGRSQSVRDAVPTVSRQG